MKEQEEQTTKQETIVNTDYIGRYKKFGGDFIPNITEYLSDIIDRDPTVTITVGNDSIQKRRRTQYANTIMIYNKDLRNGAHVVFYRESIPKVYDTYQRLYEEARYVHNIGNFLHEELDSIGYKREDLSLDERKRYKYHLLKCQGLYQNVALHDEDKLAENLHLSEDEQTMEYKLVDLHVDFNPFGDNGHNKSFATYKSAVPWLRSDGFRTYAKPSAFAATSAADLLLNN